MRSNEFIKEAPRGQPMTDAEYAAQQAQGAKTGAAIKDFVSGTPKELKDAPPGTPIDPYVRARLGYKPYAGETEPGYLLGADGNPVKDGSGQPIRTPNSPIAKAAAMPAYQARDLRDPNSLNQSAQNAQPEITIPQNQRNLRDPNSLNQPAPAYVDRIPAVKPVAPAPVAPAPVAPAPVAPAPVAPAPAPAPAPAAEPVPSFRVPGEAHRGQRGTTPGQNTTPPPAKFNMSPTVWSYAINMGLIQNGKPVDSAIRAFQKKNGLEVDGVIGNDTSNAILSVATPGMPNISRRGGAPAGAEREYTPFPKRVNQIGGRFPKGVPLVGPDGTTPVPALANKTGAQQVKTLPTGNNSTPAAAETGGYPDRITDPEGYKKEINRRLLKKYAGSASATPAAASSVVIKPGDTLSRIAAANGTTVQAIMAANPSIRDQNTIAAGQTVKLRESSEVARIRHLAGLTRN